jgi:hypothetical protein
LFNEAEQIMEEAEKADGGHETITYTRTRPKRQPLPESLPREQVIHDLDEADKSQSYMWVYCSGG